VDPRWLEDHELYQERRDAPAGLFFPRKLWLNWQQLSLLYFGAQTLLAAGLPESCTTQ
jgi:hypothetical protein